MNKQQIYDFLKEQGIKFEAVEHKAVFNMAEMAEVTLPYPEADAKNLFVRDDKKRNYYLITVRGTKRVDLNEFRQKYGTRRLSFASDADLLAYLGLTPGSVTPLGLLNDAECKVQFCIDEEFLQPDALIGVHPNDNTARLVKHHRRTRQQNTTGTHLSMQKALPVMSSADFLRFYIKYSQVSSKKMGIKMPTLHRR